MNGAQSEDIVAFAERVLGWKLEDKQRELLEGPSRRVIFELYSAVG